MILWITGNTGAGKTTLAKELCNSLNTVNLDGDDIRNVIGNHDMSEDSRIRNCKIVADLALMLEKQGLCVVVSVIAPYVELRKEIKRRTNCKFMYLPGGKSGKDFPYEPPEGEELLYLKEVT